MEVSLAVTYEILVEWAKQNYPRTYTDLSNAYSVKASCGWVDPHGGWNKPLGALANAVAAASMPPLTAMVILKTENEPGQDFWGCAPNIPPYIKNDEKRLTAWTKIVAECHSYDWPTSLPEASSS